jgi:hypothetical protein
MVFIPDLLMIHGQLQGVAAAFTDAFRFFDLHVAIRAITFVILMVGVGNHGEFHPLGLRNDLPGQAVFVIFNRFLEGIGPQIGTVQLVFGESLQGFGHVFVGYLTGFVQGFPFGHFGEHAGNRDGRPAAEGLELDVLNAIFGYLQVDGHHVPAEGIAHFADTVGVFYFAHVAGILEVIHNDWGIHVGLLVSVKIGWDRISTAPANVKVRCQIINSFPGTSIFELET